MPHGTDIGHHRADGLLQGARQEKEHLAGQRRRAALFVAVQANDIDDRRMLLDMLGLLPEVLR